MKKNFEKQTAPKKRGRPQKNASKTTGQKTAPRGK
jgi:hypothetical protein